MQRLHLTADLRGCRCEPRWLLDADALVRFCVDSTRRAGLSPVAQLCHGFGASPHGPGGVTATVLLAESHTCVHPWPEHRAVTLDVFVCNPRSDRSGAAHMLLEALLAVFDPAQLERHALPRGSIA